MMACGQAIIARSAGDEAIQKQLLDCFAEFIIGSAIGRTRRLATTGWVSHRFTQTFCRSKKPA